MQTMTVETLGTYRSREEADDHAQACSHFLAMPVIVSRTFLDRILGRWRIITMREWLRYGFRW